MTTPFQLIQEFKFTEAVGLLASTNVNERGNIIFQLKKADGTLLPYAAISVNALEALCFMNSVLSLTSNSLEQLNGRGMILKNCIKAAYNKMKNYDNTIWDGRDNNGNTTAQWLAWGGAARELKDLLNIYPDLIEDEKNLPRNAFNVTMEVGHLTANQKEKIYEVLSDMGLATPHKAIRLGKLDAAYNVLNANNVNDITTEALKINNVQVMSNTKLTPFTAICALSHIENLQSSIQKYALEMFEKMKNFSITDWKLKDSANCTLFQWGAWTNSPKLVEAFGNLENSQELIKIEQQVPRNVFDVVMEQPHITEKEAISHILISKGIFLNNIDKFFTALSNAKLKDIILKEINKHPKEIFSQVADKIITKYGELLTALKNANVRDNNMIAKYMQEANEVITEIFKKEKIDVKLLLQKEIAPNTNYESTFLHWLLELGNKNLENLVKQYDQEKQFNFYVKDSSNITVAEWIANYRMDLLKYLADNGYLNSDNKDENIKILTALITNTSKVNLSKEIAPLVKSLTEHEPPLFYDRLDSVKDAINNKSTTLSGFPLVDFQLCLGYINNYESKMETLGNDFNPYD
ncbi:hypothetical protein H6P87_00774 [Rickettsia tillamookensis]|uniref:Uncharacterized protein n=1 Tax=Rickettsia tillamookensis TaxID=2761623 RepID=A0A9E6MI68_9RICK|nr:hypothetical protein [Rickettsia tillamookensis]QQV75225.1 hypothetical protein H6P87_00774 [Rickettsia tillamookensis]